MIEMMNTNNEMNPDSIKILLVEDNPADARLTRIALENIEMSVEVHHVESAETAREYIESGGRVDIILSDFQLPGLNGMELHDRLLQKTSSIPFLLVTGAKVRI